MLSELESIPRRVEAVLKANVSISFSTLDGSATTLFE